MAYKLLPVRSKDGKFIYQVVDEKTMEVKKTFWDDKAAREYAQELNAYGEKR